MYVCIYLFTQHCTYVVSALELHLSEGLMDHTIGIIFQCFCFFYVGIELCLCLNTLSHKQRSKCSISWVFIKMTNQGLEVQFLFIIIVIIIIIIVLLLSATTTA